MPRSTIRLTTSREIRSETAYFDMGHLTHHRTALRGNIPPSRVWPFRSGHSGARREVSIPFQVRGQSPVQHRDTLSLPAARIGSAAEMISAIREHDSETTRIPLPPHAIARALTAFDKPSR